METIFHKVILENASYGIAVGHSQMRHPVQGRTSHQHLRRLPGKLSRTDALAEDRFQAKHLRLGKTATMIPDFLLPPFASHLPDAPQLLISTQRLLFAVAVRPNPGILLRRYRRLRSPLFDGFITEVLIITAIAADLLNLFFDLFEQLFDDLPITDIVTRHHCGNNLAAAFISTDMEFAPRPALAVAVLPDFPFAFAKDFDARRINDQMQSFAFAVSRQGESQAPAVAAQGGEVGCRHLKVEQVDERRQQAFGGAQREMINLFESRHTGDGDVAIGVRATPFVSLLLIDPEPQDFVTKPEREASALHESRVILFPVAEAIGAFGVFFLHKSRIPALSSPCFMQQSHRRDLQV
jgi:hypothetical protein